MALGLAAVGRGWVCRAQSGMFSKSARVKGLVAERSQLMLWVLRSSGVTVVCW